MAADAESARLAPPVYHQISQILRAPGLSAEQLKAEIEVMLQMPTRPGTIERLRVRLAHDYVHDGELDAAHGTLLGLDDDDLREYLGEPTLENQYAN
jgi:hypothetical protein